MSQAKNARAVSPWVYPYSRETDSAFEEHRRELVEGTDDVDIIVDRMETAHWQRCADHAARWLAANATAPQEKRDRAFAYFVIARGRATKAGGRKSAHTGVDELEQAHYETGNPLYAWERIAQILIDHKPSKQLFGPVGVELPFWCAQVLSNFVYGLITLGTPGHRPPTGKNVLKALALFSQGKSAYSTRTRRWREQSSADLVAELQAAGLPPQRARAVGFPNITDTRTLRRVSKKVAPRVQFADDG